VSERWTILSPISIPSAGAAAAGPVSLDRPIAGVRVGLEIDYAWQCYVTIIDEWERLLEADGARPVTLWVERSRDEPGRDPSEIRADIDEWSKLVDCGVVGLGN
jgi:hypothetical protein